MSIPERTFEKDPEAVKQYGFDWSASAADGGPYLETGETITAATWTVPSGITNAGDSFTDTVTSITLSGGSDAASYIVECKIVTDKELDGGTYHTEERSFEVQVREG